MHMVFSLDRGEEKWREQRTSMQLDKECECRREEERTREPDQKNEMKKKVELCGVEEGR